MTAVRLETRVHVITCSRTALTNAIECCNKAGLAVERATYSGLASSAAVLSDEERELGVVLVDIGGGTTDIAVWYDNALVHPSLECGGDELTPNRPRPLHTGRGRRAHQTALWRNGLHDRPWRDDGGAWSWRS